VWKKQRLAECIRFNLESHIHCCLASAILFEVAALDNWKCTVSIQIKVSSNIAYDVHLVLVTVAISAIGMTNFIPFTVIQAGRFVLEIRGL
jgi:hypothetical protein